MDHHRTITKTCIAGAILLALALVSGVARSQATAVPPALLDGKKALEAKDFTRAKTVFKDYFHAHPSSVDAELGLADAELGLHEYEAAEWDYRRVVDAEPQLWIAHKNLVIVEAALGRWEEFDRERAVLRAARERGAPGITARESDIIDSLDVHGQHWIVREYFEPVGRSEARYNFERFSPEGRIEEYISLEPAEAAKQALSTGGEVVIGKDQPPQTVSGAYSLNWYTLKAHGRIALYPHGEPTYERTRADLLRWLRRQK